MMAVRRQGIELCCEHLANRSTTKTAPRIASQKVMAENRQVFGNPGGVFPDIRRFCGSLFRHHLFKPIARLKSGVEDSEF
jgi:hypothetical protein